MDFLNGYIYLAQDNEDFTNNINPLIDMYRRYTDKLGPRRGYIALNRAAYDLSFYAQEYIYSNYTDAQINSAFEFCGFNCSMIVINANDPYTYAISSYYYQLANGSCSNSIFASTQW